MASPEKAPLSSAKLWPAMRTISGGFASETVPDTATDVAAVRVPSVGLVISTTGSVVSSVTSTASDALPKALAAVAVRVLAPSLRSVLDS